ncbi:hypothetical protein PCANC_12932 [Puccinia coronata f. sp. avenae]|uniref:Uncharacterized protein n=1 Tax=Puccinia coronata f. sp. avenae TaxID=200324 RepID=A0A2N5RV27_9BASI|nr:hypothetical protein PCANC_28840 [Puccinia coronata f. sp. avenae]PLW39214.1 hypothetical protein PCANC_12946 [Puccinia coronata f. sp. avenae]PLW39227.1 hypothetical protein PCANC_12932 [Puccinia coronata f. sp. avenae]
MSGFEPSSAAVGKELHESIQASDERRQMVLEYTAGALCKKSHIPGMPLSPSHPKRNFDVPETAHDTR